MRHFPFYLDKQHVKVFINVEQLTFLIMASIHRLSSRLDQLQKKPDEKIKKESNIVEASVQANYKVWPKV